MNKAPGKTIRRTRIRWVCVVCLLGTTGCGTTGYLGHRARDAADVFTLSAGVHDGVKIRVGPLHVGAVRASDLVGLRGGQFFANGNSLFYNEEKIGFFPMPPSSDWIIARRELDERERALAAAEGRKPPRYRWQPNLFGSEIFVQDRETPCFRRGKNIMVHAPGPFWIMGASPSAMTQIEFSAGLLLGVRVGFNPGELLDFLVGFVGLDLYGDDVE